MNKTSYRATLGMKASVLFVFGSWGFFVWCFVFGLFGLGVFLFVYLVFFVFFIFLNFSLSKKHQS